jgi:triacylglycerol lipase
VEVILLEGPDFVYLPSHDATRIDLGEFWRSISFADLKDHEMQKYLRRIASKTTEAMEVPYNQRAIRGEQRAESPSLITPRDGRRPD